MGTNENLQERRRNQANFNEFLAGFAIVTNTRFANRQVVRFYNQRGKAEQWIKEGKQAVKITWSYSRAG